MISRELTLGKSPNKSRKPAMGSPETLMTEQLHWILDGIDAMIRHSVRQYQIAG